MERIRSGLVSTVALLAALTACNPTRPTLDQQIVETELQDAEVQVAATDPSEEFPDGRVYMSANRHLYASLDGAGSFVATRWDDLEGINADCPPAIGFRGDTDIVVPRAVLAPGGFQHAYAVALYGFIQPGALAVVRTGPSGRFDEPGIQCKLVLAPADVGFADKTSAALDNFLQDALYVTYQDGRKRVPPNPPAAVGHIWLQKVNLSPSDGSLGFAASPQMLQAPGEDGPAEMIWGNCTPQPVEDMGRGNLYATPTGTLYLAFSNNLAADPECGPEWRRIYVSKLNGPNRFISCVDQYLTSDCASQSHIEESDPEIVVDPQSQKIAVVYSKGPLISFDPPLVVPRRISLATAPLSGQGWNLQNVFDGQLSDADQTQPAIALSTFTDSIDRVFSGTIFVTWYQATAGGRVERRTRGFFSSGAGWQSNTAAFEISGSSFFPINPLAPYPESRGVYEYQGVAHHPGLLGQTGGWIGAWTQPSPGTLVEPQDGDFRIAFATWL